MPTPIALCVERIDASSGSPRFVRCTALVGRQPGLRLGPGGELLWQPAEPVAAELWVSGDDRLILYRPCGAPPLTLSRASRTLDVPEAKPVVAVDQDEVVLAGCHLRLHVHGPAQGVAAPEPLRETGGKRSALGRAAAVAIGSAVVAAGGCVEVRDRPPDVAPTFEPPTPQVQPPVAPTNTIEVRDFPPAVAIEPDPAPPVQPPPAPNNTIEIRETPPEVAP